MFEKQNPVVEFEETKSETRSAVLCNITVNSITHKYRIKTLQNDEETRRARRSGIYLIELYCYKLLESIEVGPKVVFIPNCVASKFFLYIGSEWLADFQSFSSTEQVDTTEVSRAVVQTHFLVAFLSLGDMYEEHFGIDASSDPIILDYTMSNYRGPQFLFLNEDHIIYSKRARDILKNCDPTTRLHIAKDDIRKLKLMDKLDEVLEFINTEKLVFGRKKIDFDQKTQDLEKFVEK